MSLNASTAGLRALRLILELPTTEAGTALGKISSYLTYPEDQKALDYIRQHFASTGKMPHPDTLMDQITVFLPKSNETLEFEIGQLRSRWIEDNMREASDLATGLLAEGKAEDALTSMIHKLLPVTQSHGGYSLTDLRKTSQTEHYLSALNGELPKTEPIGFPTMDRQGGIEDGDIVGLIGRPGSGKTWLMLYTAIKRWSSEDHPPEPVMFVTQEMAAMQIERRALPLIAGVDPTPLYRMEEVKYKAGGHSQDVYNQKIAGAQANLNSAAAPFLIYDSKMAGTVADIEAIALMHGVRRIWIDGAYMLRHPDPRLNRYARVAENLDLLKQFTQRTGAAVVTSWQFKRGAGKENMDEEAMPDLDDIGYSHAIGEYCGVILGLLENPKQVKEHSKKKVTVMKGRNGEQGAFPINWNFEVCDFTEIEGEEMDEGVTYI